MTGRGYPPVPMLRLGETHHLEMIGHAFDAFPLEACGLLAGPPGTGKVEACYPCGNDAASAKPYTVNPRDDLRADRGAESRWPGIGGVFPPHTHTEPYPSPTDVAQA